MNTSLFSGDIEVRTRFRRRVVIAYEDPVTAQRAIKIYQRLREHPMEGCQWEHRLWDLNDLRTGTSPNTAGADLAGADLAMISAHGMIELPLELQTWIESWMDREPRPGALAVLLDRRAIEARAGVRAYFQEAARILEIPFFLQGMEEPEISRSELSEGSLLGVSSFPGWLEDAFPAPRWGINE